MPERGTDFYVDVHVYGKCGSMDSAIAHRGPSVTKRVRHESMYVGSLWLHGMPTKISILMNTHARALSILLRCGGRT